MRRSRLSDRDDWFVLWREDKESMIEIMSANLNADLEAGYTNSSKAIIDQRETMRNYTQQFNAEIDMFKTMDEKSVNRWCFYDLVKRGAII